MNDHPDTDGTTEALIDSLRAEITELEGVDDNDVAELPVGIRNLLARVPAEPRIAATLDDLIATDDPISNGLAMRIRTGAESIRIEQGTNLRFLEQIVTHARAGRDLPVSDVASHISAHDDLVSDIERGRAAFNRLQEEQVAEWIGYLEIDLDAAVEALRRSLAAPASAYGGDNYDADQADEFVGGVEAILRRNADAVPPS